jgi:hypothetical protein
VSQWPDPSPEPGEPPRWLGWGALVAIVAGIVIWNPGGESAGSWRLPEFRMPEITLPEFASPDASTSEDNASTLATSADIAEEASPLPPAPDFSGGAPVVRNVPFETCVGMLDNSSALGPQIIVEDDADRRIVRFKLQNGNMTMTCSRADSTMTVERDD